MRVLYCLSGEQKERQNARKKEHETNPKGRKTDGKMPSLWGTELDGCRTFGCFFTFSGTKKKNVLGVARTVLERANGRKGLQALFELCYEELIKIEGIGQVRAVQLLCVAEISKRLWRVEEKREVTISYAKGLCDALYATDASFTEGGASRRLFGYATMFDERYDFECWHSECLIDFRP